MNTSPTLLTAYRVDPAMINKSPFKGLGPPVKHRIRPKTRGDVIYVSTTEQEFLYSLYMSIKIRMNNHTPFAPMGGFLEKLALFL